MLPQLARRAARRRARCRRAASGCIATGLAKKIVIGDFLAQNHRRTASSTTPERFSSLEVLVAVYAYAIQIYADFSGYTDVAIGSARALRLRAARELRRAVRRAEPAGLLAPLAHLAVSTWLRDYLYMPLGGIARRARCDVPQPDDHDGPRRPLARRVVELRHLGRRSTAARSRSTRMWQRRARAKRASRPRRGAGRSVYSCDVPLRVLRVDLLPRAELRARQARALADRDGHRRDGEPVTPRVLAVLGGRARRPLPARRTGRSARARPSCARRRSCRGSCSPAVALASTPSRARRPSRSSTANSERMSACYLRDDAIWCGRRVAADEPQGHSQARDTQRNRPEREARRGDARDREEAPEARPRGARRGGRRRSRALPRRRLRGDRTRASSRADELWAEADIVLKVRPPIVGADGKHEADLPERGRPAHLVHLAGDEQDHRRARSPRARPRCSRWTACRASRARRRWTRSRRWRTSPATARSSRRRRASAASSPGR